MLDEYIAHGDLILDDLLYSGDELYHWKLGFSMPNHKWIERLGTPGHYVYKYADDLHEAFTGDRRKKYFTEQAKVYGKAAKDAKTAAENSAAAAIVAGALGRQEDASAYRYDSEEYKARYEEAEKYAQAYSDAVREISNWPINRLRRNVRNFVGETANKFSNWANTTAADFVRKLFGKEKPKPKPRPKPSRPDRPHQRKPHVEYGTSHVKKGEKKIHGMSGWKNTFSTGQELMDAAAKIKQKEREKLRKQALREAEKWLKK